MEKPIKECPTKKFLEKRINEAKKSRKLTTTWELLKNKKLDRLN